mgnify:FL=1
MGKTKFRGEELEAAIKRLPQGKPQMDAYWNAIRQADEAGDPYWRMMFRCRYCYEATFRDDPPKAIPVAAEFCALFEENSEAFIERSPDGASEMHLMIMQMGIDPIVFLPQIPMKQWETMMAEFYRWVKYYHIGLRTYWWQMARFWRYVDRKKAYEYFQKFWKTGRDGLSDCRTCERSYAVQMELLMGNRAAADEYAKPMEQGRMRFCPDTPHLYWLAYLEDALDRGDLREAEKRANALYRKGNRDKSDLSYIGAVLRCWAYTDPERALEVFAKRLEWSIGLWDQKKVYDFDKGACVLFQRLAKHQQMVHLELPQAFPLWREDGAYSTKELANWFREQAETISRRFDERNGSHCFGHDLAVALAKR